MSILSELVEAVKKPDDFLTKFARKAGIDGTAEERADWKEKERLAVHAAAMIKQFDAYSETDAWGKLLKQFQAAIEAGRTPEPLPDRHSHQQSYLNSCDNAKDPARNTEKRLRDAVQPVRNRLATALLLEADRIEGNRKTEASEIGHEYEGSSLVHRLRREAAALQAPSGARSLKQLLPFLNLD